MIGPWPVKETTDADNEQFAESAALELHNGGFETTKRTSFLPF